MSGQRRWFVTVLPVADPQLVGQVVIAVATVLASGGAAFFGSRSAKRSTEVEDKRSREIAEAEDKRIRELAAAEGQRIKEAAEWDRIHRMVTMAFSSNLTESRVGVELLKNSKADWNDNPEQRKFIRNVLSAMIAAPVQAYGGSQTTVLTSASPLSSAAASSAAMTPGGTS